MTWQELTRQEWGRRHAVARDTFVPWVDAAAPLAGRTVLEYGCGEGAVSCAFAPGVARYIGVDIDDTSVRKAQARAAAMELGHVELSAHPVQEILDAVRAHAGEVDVFLLYAVIEHLTLDERVAVLELARETVRPDGAIVVVETPNRLIGFDFHSSQLPFFSQLPDELALRYADRSLRRDYHDAIAVARAGGPEAASEALTRWGRGASYHEFELVFGDLGHHLLAGGWDDRLLGERIVYPEEVALGREMARRAPWLDACWSRYWIDCILSPTPLDAPTATMRPHSMEPGPDSRGARWTSEIITMNVPDAVLHLQLPQATRRMVLQPVVGADELVCTARRRDDGREIVTRRPATPSVPQTVEFTFDVPCDDVEVRLDPPGWVVCATYEATPA